MSRAQIDRKTRLPARHRRNPSAMAVGAFVDAGYSGFAEEGGHGDVLLEIGRATTARRAVTAPRPGWVKEDACR